MSESPDRIKITLGRTIQLRQFEPVVFSVTYEQDKQGKEKPEKCIARVEKLVTAEFNKLSGIIEKNRK